MVGRAAPAAADDGGLGWQHMQVEQVVAASVGSFSGDRVMMVGDRPETDGRFAERLGCRFALVRSMAIPRFPHSSVSGQK